MSLFQPQNKRTAASPASDTPPSENVRTPTQNPQCPQLLTSSHNSQTPVAPKSLKPARPTKATNFEPVRLNGKNWAKLEDQEAQLAAYLRFQNTSDLREFAISWPVLLAEKDFALAAQKTTKAGVLKLLCNPESRSEIVAVDSAPQLAWTWRPGDPIQYQNIQKRNIVAWTLWKMVLNVKQYKAASFAENLARTQIEQVEFLKRHTSEKTGYTLTFPETMDNFPCPELGPLRDKGENELECYNRCWEVLRYLGSGFQRGNWKRRFANIEAMKMGRTVNQSHAPSWMQTAAQPVPPDPSRPIEIEICWVHNERVPMYNETARAIEQAKSRRVAVPGSEFKFPWDPRVFANVQQFRDTIRRCLNCEALGLDLQSLRVHCYDEDEHCHDEADAFTQDWTALIAFFENYHHAKFLLAVRLKPFVIHDPAFSIYEDGNIPIDPLLYLATPDFEINDTNETPDTPQSKD